MRFTAVKTGAPLPEPARGADFWRLAGGTWYRLYRPCVPRDTGRLAEDVRLDARPGEVRVIHCAPYARRVYARSPWDRQAQARLPELLRVLQRALDEGRYP